MLDFYAYAFIADELDTYQLYLGNSYYNLATDITNKANRTENRSLWKKNKEKIENILENNFLRIVKYEFYNALEIINQDTYEKEELNTSVTKILDNLRLVYKNFNFEKNTLKFLDTFKLEIVDLFNLLEMKNGIEFLINFDYTNKSIYNEFLK